MITLFLIVFEPYITSLSHIAFINLKIFIFLIAIILGYLYFFTGYKSAFEADQQCHYELRLQFVELEGLGCDHDLETNQWILYQKGINDKPSQVVERYRY